MKQALVASYQEQLLGHLRQRILAGIIQPGERLREADLAEEFGISRGPIRDTFVRLTKEGLLEATPNVGVRVADAPSDFKRRTMVQCRRTIECDALRHAWKHNRNQLCVILVANLAEYHAACRAENLSEVVALDMAFHQAIVAAADDGSLIEIWRPLISQMFLRYSRHHSLVESYDEHKAIVDALQAEDVSSAVAALKKHIV